MGISDTYNGFANRNAASRRGFLVGALSLIAAPALVRASSIMPVKVPKLIEPLWWDAWETFDGEWRITPHFEPIPQYLAEPSWLPLGSLPCEGRLPEVSAWKSTAGPERVCAPDRVSFTVDASPVVQVGQRALPLSSEGRL
jgi:hypothetical protein